MEQRSRLAPTGALGAVILWGLTPVVTKAAVESVPPLVLLALRLPIAALLLAPFGLPLLRRLDGSTRARLVLAGLVGFLGYNLAITYGLTLLPAWLAGILLALEPVGLLAFGRLLDHEAIGSRRALGVAIALVGAVGLAVSSQAHASGHLVLLGVGLTLIATASFALYSVLLRPIAATHGTRAATSASMLVGCAPYVLALPTLPGAHLGRLTLSFWSELAFLVLGATVLGLLLWNAAAARIGTGALAVLLVLEPAASLVGSLVLLGERPSGMGIAAGVVVVIGALVAGPLDARTATPD